MGKKRVSKNQGKKSRSVRKTTKKIKKQVKERIKGSRSFYKIREDALILETLERKSKIKTSIPKLLAEKLNRTTDSVRDRIRRYLDGLTKKQKA